MHQNYIIHYPEDDERFLRYEGETKNGKPRGNGTMYYVSGGKYMGQWVDGLRHGHGVQTYGQASSGDHYDGSWKNDTKSGYGIYVWKDGARYEGEISNGLRHGYGLYKFSKYDKQKRDFYQGEWKDGVKSGLGKTYWKDGSAYVGQFDNGERHGVGKMTYAKSDDRESFDGIWLNGMKTDNGTMIWKNVDNAEKRQFNFRLGIHLVLLFIFIMCFCLCRCITSYYE